MAVRDRCMRWLLDLRSAHLYDPSCKYRHTAVYMQYFYDGQFGRAATAYRLGLQHALQRYWLLVVTCCVSLPAYSQHDLPYNRRYCQHCLDIFGKTVIADYWHVLAGGCVAVAHYRHLSDFVPRASRYGVRFWRNANSDLASYEFFAHVVQTFEGFDDGVVPQPAQAGSAL